MVAVASLCLPPYLKKRREVMTAVLTSYDVPHTRLRDLCVSTCACVQSLPLQLRQPSSVGEDKYNWSVTHGYDALYNCQFFRDLR